MMIEKFDLKRYRHLNKSGYSEKMIAKIFGMTTPDFRRERAAYLILDRKA